MLVRRASLFLIGLGAMASVAAQTMTGQGFTGLGVTPNARLLSWGSFAGIYDNQLAGVPIDPRGHNFVAGFGLLPNLEIAGRLAANSMNTNCFVENCGVRDLSASAKAAIGLDPAGRFSIAAGATDIGGAATYFRSYYGVATFADGGVEASVGLAKRSGPGHDGSRSPLDGPFASAAWSPATWLRAHVEYADRNAWAGVRLMTPEGWLPQGWSAFIGANQRLTHTPLTKRSWLTAGVTIPLYSVPHLPASRLSEDYVPVQAPPVQPAPAAASPAAQAATAPTPQVAPANQPAPVLARPAAPVNDARLEVLAEALKAKGLEDIWVGRMPDGSIAVRANNASYNWNSVDALGAALGAIARTLGGGPAAYRLVLTQRQLPLVAVTGQSDCLSSWIADSRAACAAGELSTPGTMRLDALHDGAAWQVRGIQPSWQTVRVRFSPVLRTNIGSEVGVLDYSLGVNVGVELPLWAGAWAEWRRNVPLANTSDYEPGGVFGFRRVRSATERATLTQALRVPLDRWLAPGNDVLARRWGLTNITAQASVGRIGTNYDGAIGALRWEPGEGRHRLDAQAGWFRNERFGQIDDRGPRNAQPLLASYRYSVVASRTYVEATAGQFFQNDRGFQLGMRQWFNDVSVALYYRRSGFAGDARHQMAGIELSVPIGPRRDMNPTAHLQVTGTPRFSHAVETTVREGGGNPIQVGLGVMPPAPGIEETFNSDRASLVYFEDNLPRIREAAR